MAAGPGEGVGTGAPRRRVRRSTTGACDGDLAVSRSVLDEEHIHPSIRETIGNHYADVVREVQAAVSGNDVVLVGMAQNPFPKKALRALAAAGVPCKYLEYGNYFGEWRKRNALKMWTGWPTFPMVFVKGVLVGGASDLERLIASGELKRMLESA
jgi:monothiol glutaredoxin